MITIFYTLSIVLIILIGAPASLAVDALDIGSRRELFVDHYLIDELDDARLELQEPQPAGVAVKYDEPWEDSVSFYTTVLRDGDTYRMYYRGSNCTCYAESADGIHWTKPDLGLYEVNGSTSNNVILPHAESFCAFLDNRPGVPGSERYKGNAAHRSEGGLIGYVSADGIRWNRLRDEPIVPMALENNFDSQNVMFWSPAEEGYVLYARHMEGGRRATSRATSKDFRDWTNQTLMTYSDTESTTPSAHLYTNQTHPYFRAPHIYISLAGRIFFADVIHISRQDDIAAAKQRVLTPEHERFYRTHVIPKIGGLGDFSDGVLLSTRAGTTRYEFTLMESFVRPGIGYQNWTTRNNYPALGVVQTAASEMSFYVQRDYGQKTAHLQRMRLRIDGFTSVHAPYKGGQMLTRPFTFSGSQLHINYSTSAAGKILVEIQDPDGNGVAPFTLSKSVPLVGDQVDCVVAWKAGSDVSSLAGKPIRLRFVMKDVDLFSLRFK